MILLKRAINRLGRPLGINPFPRSFENPLNFKNHCSKRVFDEIHRYNFWGSNESLSGVGSEREFTKSYRQRLVKTLNLKEIKHIFDAPCGDLNWMCEFIAESGIDYLGGDISSEVISVAQKNHPQVDLQVFDITSDKFPETDAWHCRDCLFHLPFSAVQQAFENFASSQIPYALITSHRAQIMHKNLDVGYGGFRFLDLERAPFSLPRPLSRIPDYRKGRDFPRYVCLWSREQIAESLS